MIDHGINHEFAQIIRHLHQNPEHGYKELKTSDLICAKLDKLNIPQIRYIVNIGIFAEIEYVKGICIAIKVDMDALLNQEESNLDLRPYLPYRFPRYPLVSSCKASGLTLLIEPSIL